VALSFAALGIFTLVFIINGVTILNEQQQVPADENILTF
jgi:hypothetical protein